MSSLSKTVYLLGYASGTAAADAGCCDGPLVLKDSPYMAELANQGVNLHWDTMLTSEPSHSQETVMESVIRQCNKLANAVADIVKKENFFTVFGGDHSCAIGTWSGVHHILHTKGSIGLIWIDAHMDSHTPQTSQTGNVHGMPLACLLGHGDPELTHMMNSYPKILPEHVCIIGVRSYEEGEAELLRKLGVRVYLIDEVKERGLSVIFDEALQRVNQGTIGYGLSIDIDSIDPNDAPGTGVSEPDGLVARELCEVLTRVKGDKRLIGTEIVEFDPHRDKDQKTEKLVPEIMRSFL